MIVPRYTSESFRCGRWQRSLLDRAAGRAPCGSPEDHPENERCRLTVNDAIRMAEDFARLAHLRLRFRDPPDHVDSGRLAG